MTVCQGRKGSWSAHGPSPHESDGYLHAAVPKQTVRPSSGTGWKTGLGRKQMAAYKCHLRANAAANRASTLRVGPSVSIPPPSFH